jgi:hypothetical protein
MSETNQDSSLTVTRSRPETFMTVLPVPPNRPHSQKIAFGSVALIDNTPVQRLHARAKFVNTCQTNFQALPARDEQRKRFSKLIGLEIKILRFLQARTIKIRGLEEWRHLDAPHFLAEESRQHSRAYPSGQVTIA